MLFKKYTRDNLVYYIFLIKVCSWDFIDIPEGGLSLRATVGTLVIFIPLAH